MLSGIYEPHPDVVSWFDRATTAGGTISGTAFDACERMVLRWELAGILPTVRIGLEMPFLGTNLAAALTPLYIPTGKTISSFNFVAGDWTESAGLDAGETNSSKYLNLGIIASDVSTLTSGRMSVYSRRQQPATGIAAVEIGAFSSTSSAMILAISYANTCSWDSYTNGGSSRASGSSTNTLGLFTGSRTANNSSVIYRNTTALYSASSASGTLPAASIYGFAENNNNTANNLASRLLSHIAVGRGLTAAQHTNYYNGILAKEAAMGRNV
jgi:hypothetical protein